MARRYWLLSLVPLIGGPLAFWLENKEQLRAAAASASKGYSSDGAGGALVGMVSALGHDAGGRQNELGRMVGDIAADRLTDPQLKDALRRAEAPPSDSSGS